MKMKAANLEFFFLTFSVDNWYKWRDVEQTKGISKVSKETCNESSGFGPRGKDYWWWDASMQHTVKDERDGYNL